MEVNLLRGAIIGSYAAVEFQLTDLSMRCRRLPQYAEIAENFPYSLESKIARVTKLVEAPGPLQRFAAELCALADRISAYECNRHFMAHGLMNLTEHKEVRIVFRMYRRTKSGQEYGEMQTSLDQLRDFAKNIAEYAQQVTMLVVHIYKETPLEPPLLEPDDAFH